MRSPSQTQKAVEADLKHLSTALDRAKSNTIRSHEKNVRVVQLLSELVTIYTQEKIEFIAGKFSPNKKKVAWIDLHVNYVFVSKEEIAKRISNKILLLVKDLNCKDKLEVVEISYKRTIEKLIDQN